MRGGCCATAQHARASHRTAADNGRIGDNVLMRRAS
jgi:hypothetical protein